MARENEIVNASQAEWSEWTERKRAAAERRRQDAIDATAALLQEQPYALRIQRLYLEKVHLPTPRHHAQRAGGKWCEQLVPHGGDDMGRSV